MDLCSVDSWGGKQNLKIVGRLPTNVTEAGEATSNHQELGRTVEEGGGGRVRDGEAQGVSWALPTLTSSGQ